MVLVAPVDAMAVRPTTIVFQRRLKSQSRICRQGRTTIVKTRPLDSPMKQLVHDQRHKRSRNKWPTVPPIWSCHVKIVELLSLRYGGEMRGAERYVTHAVGIAVHLSKLPLTKYRALSQASRCSSACWHEEVNNKTAKKSCSSRPRAVSKCLNTSGSSCY